MTYVIELSDSGLRTAPSTDTAEPAAPAPAPRRPAMLPRWVRSLLRIPLVGKIAGANALIVLAAMAVAFARGDGSPAETRYLVLLATALGVSLVVNVVLVLVALNPLTDLEATAHRIWGGDLQARVPPSVVADPDLQRVGSALNVLLDGLTAERARLRTLASEVIRAGDRERASIARELHDSTAQTLAALLLELSVIAGEVRDEKAVARVERVRRIASDVLDEVKLLAHTVHPRVLDDLGLGPALQLLARETEERSQARVAVEADAALDTIAPSRQSVLYRVAQEALNNALRHGKPKLITLRLGVSGGLARLEVEDDGAGFDPAEAERRRPGMGLFTMRERASLVSGTAEITSAKGQGTRVVVTVPTDSVPPTGET